MADPTAYERDYDFYAYQSANPTRPLPGQEVNSELNAIQNSFEEFLSAMQDVRRSDGALQNEIVTADALRGGGTGLYGYAIGVDASGNFIPLSTDPTVFSILNVTDIPTFGRSLILAEDAEEAVSALGLKPFPAASYTVGPTGADYTTLAAFLDDMRDNFAMTSIPQTVTVSGDHYDIASGDAANFYPGIAERLTVLGATPEVVTATDCYDVTGVKGVYDVTLVVPDASKFAPGDQVLVREAEAIGGGLGWPFSDDGLLYATYAGSVVTCGAAIGSKISTDKIYNIQGQSVTPTTGIAPTATVTAQIAAAATFTVTIASPGVVTHTAHGLAAGTPYVPSTTGALPTGLVAGTTYYVLTVLGVDTFTLAATVGGAAINTTGSQSGVHTGTPRGVLTWTSHGFVATTPIVPTTTGALPTGLTASAEYFVERVIDANRFTLAATSGGTALNFTGSQSGVHTGTAPYSFRVNEAASPDITIVQAYWWDAGKQAGTITAAGTALSGSSTDFLSTMDVGSMVLSDGEVHALTGITNNTSATLATALTVTAKPHAVLALVELHEGSWEVLSRDTLNNRVTLRNTDWQAHTVAPPPKNGFAGAELTILKTVLDVAAGNGFVAEFGAKVKSVDNIAIRGPGTATAYDTSYGVNTLGTDGKGPGSFAFGPNVGVSGFGTNVIIGPGCSVHGDYLCISGGYRGAYVYSGGFFRHRFGVITGHREYGRIMSQGHAEDDGCHIAGNQLPGDYMGTGSTAHGDLFVCHANGVTAVDVAGDGVLVTAYNAFYETGVDVHRAPGRYWKGQLANVYAAKSGGLRLTGGTIFAPTGDGLSFAFDQPEFATAWISGASGYGVRGTDINGAGNISAFTGNALGAVFAGDGVTLDVGRSFFKGSSAGGAIVGTGQGVSIDAAYMAARNNFATDVQAFGFDVSIDVSNYQLSPTFSPTLNTYGNTDAIIFTGSPTRSMAMLGVTVSGGVEEYVTASTTPGVRQAKPITSSSGSSTLTTAHRGTVQRRTGVGTIGLQAAATLTNGWLCDLWNDGTTDFLTVDPAGAETINGASTLSIPPGRGGVLLCDGTNIYFTFFGDPRTNTHGADIAAAATLVLGTSTGDVVDITGNTGITAITLADGQERTVRFTGTPTITYGASLVLPGAANITAAAGDYAVFRGYAAGVVRCVAYIRAALSPDVRTQGAQKQVVRASEMTARTTNGPAAGSIELTNLNMVVSKDYDAAAVETAVWRWVPPKSWDRGTVTCEFIWSHAATVTNFGVVWSASGIATSDGDTLDVAQGTAQTVTDTGGATNTRYRSAATPAITIGGSPAVGDDIEFAFQRVATSGSDTLTIDARLEAVVISYTVNAPNEA